MKKLLTLSVLVSSLVLACGSTPTAKSVHPDMVTVTNDIPWTFPNLHINRCHAVTDIADCLEKIGETCSPRGAIVQEIDSHDVIFVCRPAQTQGE